MEQLENQQHKIDDHHEENQRTDHFSVQFGQNKKILLIDDHPESVSLLRRALSRWGYTTKVVCDGYEAINELMQNNYDLVVLDWIMPELGGMQTLIHADKYVALDPVLSETWPFREPIPVVIYSAYKPDLRSIGHLDYFKVLDSWNKASQFRTILSNIYDTLQTI
jgi:CheY-like chemotaxis protein